MVGQCNKLSTVSKFDIFFAKIQFEFDQRNKFQQPSSQIGQFPTEPSPHLIHSNAMRCGGSRSYKVGYCFGLRKIEATVGKSPSGKFSGSSSATSAIDKTLDNTPSNIDRTMTRYFYRIFARIRMRCPKKRNHNLIEHLSCPVINLPVCEGMRGTVR